jgi:hypothetical protein
MLSFVILLFSPSILSFTLSLISHVVSNAYINDRKKDWILTEIQILHFYCIWQFRVEIFLLLWWYDLINTNIDKSIVITIRLYLNEIEYIHCGEDLFAGLMTLSRRDLVQIQIICLILHINKHKKDNNGSVNRRNNDCLKK